MQVSKMFCQASTCFFCITPARFVVNRMASDVSPRLTCQIVSRRQRHKNLIFRCYESSIPSDSSLILPSDSQSVWRAYDPSLLPVPILIVVPTFLLLKSHTIVDFGKKANCFSPVLPCKYIKLIRRNHMQRMPWMIEVSPNTWFCFVFGCIGNCFNLMDL